MNNKIEIYKDSIIYVLCPAYVKTGGTELMHQLASTLKKLKYNVYIVYTNINKKNKEYMPNDFKMYDTNYVLKQDIVDDKKNVVIAPEISLEEIYKYKEIRKIIWWLSVDFYLKKYTSFSTSIKNNNVKNAIKFILTGGYIKYPKSFLNVDYNLCQSYYAIDYVEKNKGKNIVYLSDYINDCFKYDEKLKKENIVLYNPKKGFEFTKKIIERDSNIKWVPIINMTTKQVNDLLKRAKVYIDFGNHPGKDRIPREAAISGCCIITGKRGSANFYNDVMILDEFKFDDIDENIDKIIEKVRSCIDNYDIEVKKFADYRKFIESEKDKFVEDVKSFFVSIK